ncbi:RNA polymerase factor sigma-54 [Acidiphilium sp. AL]|uniref:RNA polymerase sigma-54 factor n=1 Tax=Acidiphilium iwatense TaxID=768198 RepID=A0ABS9DTI8_9PROT|nr:MULTISPECIES: RNA polymerase factor sigma-54 [Acidiphilium]MCF3945485.1 RNA polymerase factor sigma-54 [Acidiphilium iwatense]MCU4159000.1 RNA polymerase factor sigma-54 [Acidiphilium sp. AL]
MALGPRLDLRQTQSLVMTPQLRQAIQLLQFTNVEVNQFIEDELLKNPLIERADSESDATAPLAAASDGMAIAQMEAAPIPASEYGANGLVTVDADAPGAQTPLDTDFSNVYDFGGTSDGGGRDSGIGFEDDDGIGQIADRPPDLREHLEQQARLAFPDPAQRRIAAALIMALDPSGRLADTPEAIAVALGIGFEVLEPVRQVMLRFDPTGVFARDLAECLAIQLAERNRLDPAMDALLAHLDLLARRDHRALMEICGVDAEDLRDMIAELKRLNPKPGAGFDASPITPLIPDVLMRPAPDGDYMLELNPETMPRVLIRRGFHARMAAKASRETRQFLSDRIQSANWLVRALESRAETILRVAGEIVQHQGAFFRFGIGFLKPLTLREVAAALDIHESTVSRVTSNKVIATPRGVFEMKFFFTTALAGANGESHSAEAVRHRIAALIEAEPPAAILSDDALAKLLQKEGIDIARRTVAKYREALRIPGSAQRKRDKALGIAEPLSPSPPLRAGNTG